jgi:hypothetical protein
MARVKIIVVVDTPLDHVQAIEDSEYLQDQIAGVIFDIKTVVDKSALYFVQTEVEQV